MKKTILILTAMLAMAGLVSAQDAETANRMFRHGYREDIQLEANTYQQSFISTSHGYSVSRFVDRATVSILKKKLDDERLSLTQIADQMNFNTLSYFSRYCTKHLGLSPSDYRRSLQPRYK